MNFCGKPRNKQIHHNFAASEEDKNKKLVELMERTGYPIMQMNGQRIFGPPRHWTGLVPEKGSEIFVGKLPKFICEDELVPIFERVGPIYRMRLMMDFSGMNRGFAFITYTTSEHADLAVTHLNNYEIRSNRHIGVYKSIDNCRLFVGLIPQDKSREEIREALDKYVDGIVDVIMYPENNADEEGHRNRGYVFVEFDCHRSAAIARRLLGSGVKLWDAPVAVDWADPLPDVDPTIMKKVTILYIRNLNINLTSNELLALLCDYIPSEMIVRVHKISDYAFVHFGSRLDAENAFRLLQGQIIAENEIEVSWARPRIYSKEYRMNIPAKNFCTSVPPRMRKLVLMQKPTHSIEGSDTGSSSRSFTDSSSQPPSPPMRNLADPLPSSCMNGQANVCCINIHEPFMNIVNYNMMHPQKENALPSFLSSVKY